MSPTVSPSRPPAWYVPLVATIALLLSPVVGAADEDSPNGEGLPTLSGERLFIQKGCIGCHGKSGR